MAIIGGGMGVEAIRAMDESVCKEGRKYGGCAILWKPNVTGKVEPVECKKKTDCVRFLFAWQMMLPYFYLMLICHVMVKSPC